MVLVDGCTFVVELFGCYADVECFVGEWDDKSVNDRVIGVEGMVVKVKMLRVVNAYVELWEYCFLMFVLFDLVYLLVDYGIVYFCF